MSEPQQSSPLPTSIPKNCSFWILLVLPETGFTLRTVFGKKAYKYIHTFKINSIRPFISFQKFFKDISRFKLLHSFSLSYPPHLEDANIFPQLRQKIQKLQKIMKPHRKSLRNIQGALKCQVIQKLLPTIDKLELLPQDVSNWKKLAPQSAFKRLVFNFLPAQEEQKEYRTRFEKEYQPIISPEECKGFLFQSFRRLKGLDRLDIRISAQENELIFVLLEFILKKVNREYLKDFRLCLHSKSQSANLNSALMKKPEIRHTLENLTDLLVEDSCWFSSLISATNFQNLSKLELSLSPEETDSCLFEQLSCFKEMIKLKNLSLVFTANSINCQKEFLRFFTLPPTIQELTLYLSNSYEVKTMIGNNVDNQETIHAQFFDRLQSNKQILENFYLTVKDGCFYFPEAFALLLIQQFSRLVRLSYFSYTTWKAETKSLVLEDFWRVLKPSKETLRFILVFSFNCIFPQDMSILDNEFPQLRHLLLQGDVPYAANLSAFWNGFSDLKTILLHRLALKDENQLTEFFNNIKEIPVERAVLLSLDVANIEQNALIACLSRFIEDMRIQCKLKMLLVNVQAQDLKEFGVIIKLALQRGCFQYFMAERKAKETLFEIQRHKIISIKNEIISKE